jgi:dienelactone hydrolase
MQPGCRMRCVKLAALPLMSLNKLPKIIRPAAAAMKAHRCIQVAGVVALAVFWLPLAQAVVPDIQCPDGSQAAGGIERERVGNSSHCVVIRKFEPATATTSSNAKVLVVFLPGDSRGSVESPAERGTAFNLSQQLKASTIALQREDDRSDTGISDGTEGNSSAHDDYTPGNVAILARALDRLRALNRGKKILLIGHSGGAAMTALLASRFPASADAYLLAACPCDVPQWRQWRNAPTGKAGRWAHSLSPQDEVGKIKASTRIALVVGNRDDNTLAKFSEAYVAGLQRQGVKTRLTYAIGATHVSVLRSPEFFMLAQELAAELSR